MAVDRIAELEVSLEYQTNRANTIGIHADDLKATISRLEEERSKVLEVLRGVRSVKSLQNVIDEAIAILQGGAK